MCIRDSYHPVEGQDGTAGRTDKKDPRAKEKGKKRKFLDTYCENLTGKAQEGKLDQIIGRDKEIYRAIQILCRRQKNNPCLIGEAGVGKTAIAEGIALRIAEGKVPSRLEDKEIYLLDLTALVAGTQFRGQFESRVKGLISEVKMCIRDRCWRRCVPRAMPSAASRAGTSFCCSTPPPATAS